MPKPSSEKSSEKHSSVVQSVEQVTKGAHAPAKCQKFGFDSRLSYQLSLNITTPVRANAGNIGTVAKRKGSGLQNPEALVRLQHVPFAHAARRWQKENEDKCISWITPPVGVIRGHP